MREQKSERPEAATSKRSMSSMWVMAGLRPSTQLFYTYDAPVSRAIAAGKAVFYV